MKKEIKELKQQLNKEQLESKLKTEYAKKQKEGEVACRKRMLDHQEALVQKEIDDLKKQEVTLN